MQNNHKICDFRRVTGVSLEFFLSFFPLTIALVAVKISGSYSAAVVVVRTGRLISAVRTLSCCVVGSRSKAESTAQGRCRRT